MNKYYCDHEHEVFEAVRSGALDSPLKAHISRCAICADVMMVTQWLGEQSDLTDPEINLPDASFLRWKAQLRSRDSALARATRPIDLVATVGTAAAGLTGIWFVSTSSAAREWIFGFIHPQILQHAAAPYWGVLALLGGIGTLACILVGTVFTLRT